MVHVRTAIKETFIIIIISHKCMKTHVSYSRVQSQKECSQLIIHLCQRFVWAKSEEGREWCLCMIGHKLFISRSHITGHGSRVELDKNLTAAISFISLVSANQSLFFSFECCFNAFIHSDKKSICLHNTKSFSARNNLLNCQKSNRFVSTGRRKSLCCSRVTIFLT